MKGHAAKWRLRACILGRLAEHCAAKDHAGSFDGGHRLAQCRSAAGSPGGGGHPQEGADPEAIFGQVYEFGVWGRSDRTRYYSGSGSYTPHIVLPYIKAMAQFLCAFPDKPDLVDLGCGDFRIGAVLRRYCRTYIACDVVGSLIDFNREKFGDLDVDFRTLDITRDELPAGDVATVRQVLQHLSNDSILRFLDRCSGRFSYLCVTEHVPDATEFPHNRDQSTGPWIRLEQNSGVVLTSPPFNLKAQSASVVCEANETSGIVRTIIYRL